MTSERVVVDSLGWIEVFTDGGHADHFLALMANEHSLVVPAISIFEVFKWVLREHVDAQAIQAAPVMQRGHVVDLDSRLPLADSIILATARDRQARLHTMDSDFRGIADVTLIPSTS